MQLTFDVPDDLAVKIRPMQDRLPYILALGLREFEAESLAGFHGVADVLEFLAGLPAPREILAFRPSAALRKEVARLLEKNRDTGLTPAEEERWKRIEYLEHLIRKAKIRAAQQMAVP
ncbi:MAG: hypothetical protein U5O69_07305 [Candidatus Competibacteraceae bacterium]|nr:hypothetical protein [Candidatus Competibacteraceae bacterium]